MSNNCLICEEQKPYRGFKKGKNHPEGGLSRAEAKRQGIHAGIETKDEAKRKGGFGKLSKKTQSRRKSFCARMCGMKKRRTSSKTANDPKSKINAALRVWGCRCGVNESYENINEVYKKSGLGKWFHGETANKEPGWDRYDTSGKRVGKCGDAKEGSSYAACLSKQKASKLGKKKIAQFVTRKRLAQRIAGRGKKGSGSKGMKPILVSTGISENRFSLGLINLHEKNKPQNPKLWSKAISLAKRKFDVYPSAYANAWASKWYKKNGGSWNSIKEERTMNIKKYIIEKIVAKLNLGEEIVNKSNAGSMTPNEIRSRDRIAKNIKVKVVKRGDSLRDAKFRTATAIVLRNRGKEGYNKKSKKKQKP